MEMFFSPETAPDLADMLLKRVHNLSYINAIGAPGAAGMAGSAEPYGFRGQHLFPVAILDMAEHLVGQDIHGEIQGTSGRTLLALITVLYRFSALLNDFRQQGYILICCLLSHIHRLLQF